MNDLTRHFVNFLLIAGLLASLNVSAVFAQDDPNPRNAFLRSLVLPGWGHYYVDNEAWGRGQFHLGTEAILVASYFGLNRRVSNLENHYKTLSNLRAGLDIRGRDRELVLAMGQFNSLEEYNQQQLITRNWNRLFDDHPDNRWNWETEEDRRTFADLRSNRDRLRNQLPALLSLMVVNRVISGVSAFNRARNKVSTPEVTIIPVPGNEKNILANVRFWF